MRSFQSVLLPTLVLLLAACNWLAFLPADDNSPQASEAVGTFTGVVIENNHGCTVDAACSFTIQIDDGAIYDVIYHYGEFPPCSNTAPFDTAFALEPGDRVEVVALAQSESALSICDSEIYTVTRDD